MNWKNIFLSWDIWVAVAVAILAYLLLPATIKNDLVGNLYNVGISVLAIVFSVYFAALAVIISSGDNEFVYFLEETGDFTIIISSFRFSLVLLFIALLYSILMYALTAVWSADNQTGQRSLWFCAFVFLFIYSLIATAISSLDAIKYANHRIRFLQISERRKAKRRREQNQDDQNMKTGT